MPNSSYKVEIKPLTNYKAEEILEKENCSEAELLFLPLMEGEVSISRRIKRAIEKYKQIEKDEKKIVAFSASILVLANRELTKNEFDEIWEEIKMLNVIRFAEEKGIEKGIEKERIVMGERLLEKNMSIEEVAELTELSVERVKELVKKKAV